jgi:hypothetical protein
VADRTARFAQAEIRLGLIPGAGGTQRLARLVGPGQAMRIALSGDTVDAEEAYRIGLVEFLVDEGKHLEKAIEVAERMARWSPVALRLAKRSIRAAASETPLSAGLELERELFLAAFASEDGREGVKAFVEKRKPDLPGAIDPGIRYGDHAHDPETLPLPTPRDGDPRHELDRLFGGGEEKPPSPFPDVDPAAPPRTPPGFGHQPDPSAPGTGGRRGPHLCGNPVPAGRAGPGPGGDPGGAGHPPGLPFGGGNPAGDPVMATPERNRIGRTAPTAPPSPEEGRKRLDLEDARTRILEVDDLLIRTIGERRDLVLAIARAKEALGLPVLDPGPGSGGGPSRGGAGPGDSGWMRR